MLLRYSVLVLIATAALGPRVNLGLGAFRQQRAHIRRCEEGWVDRCAVHHKQVLLRYRPSLVAKFGDDLDPRVRPLSHQENLLVLVTVFGTLLGSRLRDVFINS